MPRVVCSLNIIYSGTADMLQFILIGSISYKNHQKITATNNFALTREGYISQMSFEVVLDRLFKKIRLTDIVKRARIRTVLEKRFREFSEMMKECLEDGSLKISNKGCDRYVITKPETFYYRKYKIFKNSNKSEFTIDFEEPHKKLFVIPSINGAQRSHSEGSFQESINKMPQTTVDNGQVDYSQGAFQDGFQETFHDTSHDTLEYSFNEAFHDTLEDPFQDTFHEPIDYSFNNDSWQ